MADGSGKTILRKKSYRTPGVKPVEYKERTQRVISAVKELEEIGAGFTIADIADRSGISRATIYRDASLRKIIGARGDGARNVPYDIHSQLSLRNERLKIKVRELQKRLTESELNGDDLRRRAVQAENQQKILEHQAKNLMSQLSARSTAHTTTFLSNLAGAVGIASMKRARRQIASALHPDLFAKDPDVAKVAEELLRALNNAID